MTEHTEHAAAAMEMPFYQCHKKVWALKIRDTYPLLDGGAMIVPDEQGYAPFTVDAAYLGKHKPQVGGYYVVYKDGYRSYSTSEAFEEGYTRIP